MKNIYIPAIKKQFDYYKLVGDKTFEQLSFQDMQWAPNETSNSISVLVKHMVGNMLSRWTNFLTEDGEKNWRHRDLEFEQTYINKKEIIAAWENGWSCLYNALNSLNDSDLNKTVYIRNEGHLVSEAIFRQLGHYPYHIGQIAYIGKLLIGNDWVSLSIPKGKSTSFNKQKFSKEKGRRHFTDNL
ncbi:DUF1572 family protein [Formosa maritima]|uniref:DUF1572 domain-containing protein n=1 Tax=Formosa maritima TaxID=2592046 RepID=A0A5D0GBI9_9FLAO|nr:DUF1572 family protein [Formosa maritima]TYA56348.1 DUF1572 domain-containing protein [Formosa maritima]